MPTTTGPLFTRFLGRIIDRSKVVSADRTLFPNYKCPIGHAYAPAIVRHGNSIHLFFCSAKFGPPVACSGGTPGTYDMLRYTKSNDGKTWSTPSIILHASTSTDRAVCDPTVVFFNGYFYIYYTGNVQGPSTRLGDSMMFVARSSTIDGPYSKYTERGTWETNPNDPRVIIPPLRRANGTQGWYGAGGQTVVNRNGTLHSWHYDDTSAYPDLNRRKRKLFHSVSTDATTWSSPTEISFATNSPDVVYHPNEDRFLVFYIEPHHKVDSALYRRESSDGVTWGAPQTLIPSRFFPNWSHNLGVEKDSSGHLASDDEMLIAYGATHTLDVDDAFRADPEPDSSYDLLGHALRNATDRRGMRTHYHTVDSTGDIAKIAYSANVVNGEWSGLARYRIGGNNWCVLSRTSPSGSRTWLQVHKIKSNGELSCAPTHAHYDEYSWTSGWAAATAFDGQGAIYCLFLKQDNVTRNTEIAIHEITSSGDIAKIATHRHSWSLGWNAACAYMVGQTTYCLFTKSQDSRTFIDVHTLNNNGNISANAVHSHRDEFNWSSGWRALTAYRSVGTSYCVFSKNSTGSDRTLLAIHRLSSDGDVWQTATHQHGDEYQWRSEWFPGEITKDGVLLVIKATDQ